MAGGMAQYQLFLRNKRGRYRYPKSVNVPDIEAAHRFALRMTKVLLENTLLWRGWSSEERTNFVVDVTDETGQSVLMAPSQFVAAAAWSMSGQIKDR